MTEPVTLDNMPACTVTYAHAVREERFSGDLWWGEGFLASFYMFSFARTEISKIVDRQLMQYLQKDVHSDAVP